ncbi:MAG: hypothetical protein CMC14_04160 [Flavobacteriaceae bacterium]|nr:hypothetical protein [Flavobacteriaceae bacterium]|tara:strand:- start:214775 stop:215932 length:1158 start_codon:yes stop_codon:yes gene_type:complete
MKVLLSFFIGLFSIAVAGQNSFYELIELGTFKVGYFDSIIYNEDENYQQYGYVGAAPLFVQIWHPIQESLPLEYLSYGDFRKREVPEELQEVYDNLARGIDNSFISYNISEQFETYEPLNYNGYTYEQVLDTLKKTRTKSIRHPLTTTTEFPVILYHHGGQGLPDENYIMAEYFASRGYIFISANYHLPFEGMDYGASFGVSDITSFPKKITAFAKELTTNDNLFFIGHSWGAQVGFTYLFDKNWASGFVSLETTIEFKTDSIEIKQKWPEVYKVIKTDERKYPIPVMLIANTTQNEKFSFFEPLGTKDVYHVATKNPFGHESYTAAFLMRILYNTTFPQPDSSIMKSQLILYNEHLKLIECFFNSVKEKKPLKCRNLINHFYFN